MTIRLEESRMADRNKKTRRIEKSIAIDAPIDAVWKALTEAEELVNWFPLTADSKPGVGGFIAGSWGEGEASGTMPIDIWEPPHRLRTTWTVKDEQGNPVVLAQDWELESRGGKTIVRLVDSGWLEDDSWDDQYDATDRGWDFELGGLKHYLEKHRSRQRRVVWAKKRIDVSLEEAWRRVMGSDGLMREGAVEHLKAGDRYGLVTGDGEEWQGVVRVINPPRDFAATVEPLNSAYLRVYIDDRCYGPGVKQVQLWLSLFGYDERSVADLQQKYDRLLATLFPELAA
ncbi:hypothetical protein GF420_07280 [candidate division GN15 bacterium]|nr:hypothetical protein [candidate division GN15 bacterium]